MNTKLSRLTAKERDWISEQLNGAALFVNAFSPQDADQPLTLAALDRAFAAFLETEESDGKLINSAINCVGVSFGQFLVDGLGHAWVIATNAGHSELAVHGLPGTADSLVYPANFVAKRWERREVHFLEDSYERITACHDTLAREAGAETGAGKPWWKFW